MTPCGYHPTNVIKAYSNECAAIDTTNLIYPSQRKLPFEFPSFLLAWFQKLSGCSGVRRYWRAGGENVPSSAYEANRQRKAAILALNTCRNMMLQLRNTSTDITAEIRHESRDIYILWLSCYKIFGDVCAGSWSWSSKL